VRILTACIFSHFSGAFNGIKKAAQEGQDVILEAGTA
jgi:hypothetical protein